MTSDQHIITTGPAYALVDGARVEIVDPTVTVTSHTVIRFSVVGTPTPKGSKVPITLPGGTTIMREQAGDRLSLWRHAINDECRNAFAGLVPFMKAVAVDATFWIVRPANHYTPKGVLKKGAPKYPITKTGTTGGDVDKYLRALLDAMTGVAFADDCQVVTGYERKRFVDRGQPGGATVSVWEEYE